jgi:hypothetical protein
MLCCVISPGLTKHHPQVHLSDCHFCIHHAQPCTHKPVSTWILSPGSKGGVCVGVACCSQELFCLFVRPEGQSEDSGNSEQQVL